MLRSGSFTQGFLDEFLNSIGMSLSRYDGRHNSWCSLTRIKSKRTVLSVFFVVLTAIVAVSASYSLESPNVTAYAQMSSAQYSVNIASKPGLGSYLTNATGWTLYTFWRDIPSNGTSRCAGSCIEKWPAFYVANLTLPSGLSATSFTVITRPDGSKQLAYDGWPLYYFINDMKPGDTNGQGIAQLWSVCTVPTPFSVVTSTATTSTSTTKPPSSGW
jgi:predicted lipoprotein with Yx(FWY)xxD motif